MIARQLEVLVRVDDCGKDGDRVGERVGRIGSWYGERNCIERCGCDRGYICDKIVTNGVVVVVVGRGDVGVSVDDVVVAVVNRVYVVDVVRVGVDEGDVGGAGCVVEFAVGRFELDELCGVDDGRQR